MGKPTAKQSIACSRCNAQTFDDSRKCWQCGEPLPRKGGSFSVWRVLKMLAAFPLILIMLAFVARCVPAPMPQNPQTPVAAKPRPSCPPTDPLLLQLPDYKAHMQSAFFDKALQLNASGQCVIEGNWGKDSQTFYFAVSRPEDLNNAVKWRHVRYTEAELSQ